MATQSEVFTVTPISSPTVYACPRLQVFNPAADLCRSSHLTAPTLYPHPGTRLFVSGSLPLATPPVPLSAIPTTSSQSLFPQTTVRSSQGRVTGQSNYGTL